MTLAEALRPIQGVRGVLLTLVLTRDGLPVEMIGHGLRSDAFAAEIASLAEVTRRGFETLGIGAPRGMRIDLDAYSVSVHPLPHHYLALLIAPDAPDDVGTTVRDSVLEPLEHALTGGLA